MKNRKRNSFYFIIILLLSSSCNNKTVYHSFLHIPDSGWDKNDTLSFNISVKDSMTYLHLSAEVRNKNDYPYQNLYLFIKNNLKDSSTWKIDTLRFLLIDKKGNWLGNGWGSLYQLDKPFDSLFVPHPGTFQIKISHGMKDVSLKGINDIGVRVER
ncbi:gliding motility lipoprotein GldH [uncultured Bacteroides sp.]|uniref:gliding motility lipoprotein GldH n=1 Tax=uncultured Bacteroides sp. TaxID=162156 RepID=UPI002AAAEF97|nr:gliding motility lipoprotein GldH [uncultured Bacteroides sp.]